MTVSATAREAITASAYAVASGEKMRPVTSPSSISCWVRKPPSEYLHERFLFTTQPCDEPADPKELETLISMLGHDVLCSANTDAGDVAQPLDCILMRYQSLCQTSIDFGRVSSIRSICSRYSFKTIRCAWVN